VAKNVCLSDDTFIPGRLSLLSRAFLAADLKSATFVSVAEMTEYINQSLSTELYDLLVAAYGAKYFQNSATFSTVGGTDDYAIATIAPDFYKLVKLELLITAPNRYMTLRRYDSAKQNAFPFASSTPNALSIRMTYVPVCPVLTTPQQLFDGINGWEELAVLDAAIKARMRENRDASQMMQKKSLLRQQLEVMSQSRDEGHPEVAHDFEAEALMNPGWFSNAASLRYEEQGSNLHFVNWSFFGF